MIVRPSTNHNIALVISLPPLPTLDITLCAISSKPPTLTRVRKYAKFGIFYAKIVQMTPLKLRRESL